MRSTLCFHLRWWETKIRVLKGIWADQGLRSIKWVLEIKCKLKAWECQAVKVSTRVLKTNLGTSSNHQQASTKIQASSNSQASSSFKVFRTLASNNRWYLTFHQWGHLRIPSSKAFKISRNLCRTKSILNKTHWWLYSRVSSSNNSSLKTSSLVSFQICWEIKDKQQILISNNRTCNNSSWETKHNHRPLKYLLHLLNYWACLLRKPSRLR